MNLAIIGCGLMGQKRALSVKNHTVVCVADQNLSRAKSLAKKIGSRTVVRDWQDIVKDPQIHAVIISTTHDSLTPIALACVKAGKHVLVEKPAARSVKEILPIIRAAKKKKIIVKVGFNHRFHPAFIQARKMMKSGQIGKLMFIRARYGHGGRLGYANEWRANQKISGGGELMDQAPHLIDLSRWFLGNLELDSSYLPTYFWKMKVEDNAFLSLKTTSGQLAWLHASWTEWKNLFCFEIFSKRGKLQIDGLGGSYGEERLTFYKMSPKMGPPKIKVWQFSKQDVSWDYEFKEWMSAIREKREPNGNLSDALAALQLIEQARRRSK